MQRNKADDAACCSLSPEAFTPCSGLCCGSSAEQLSPFPRVQLLAVRLGWARAACPGVRRCLAVVDMAAAPLYFCLRAEAGGRKCRYQQILRQV